MTKKKRKPPFAPSLVPRFAPRSLGASTSVKLREQGSLRPRSSKISGRSSASCPPVVKSTLPGSTQTLPSISSPVPSSLVSNDEIGSGSEFQRSPSAFPLPITAPAANPPPPLPVLDSSPSCKYPTKEGPSSPSQGKKWSSLFSDTVALKSYGPLETHVSGVPFILIPDENIAAAKEEFKDFIYAYFPGHPPEMGRIIGVINAIWAPTGPRIFVHKIGPGCFLLKVPNPKTRGILLSRNLWNNDGHPMCVAP